MPIPILIAAAELLLGEAVVDSTIAAAAEFLGVNAIVREVQASLMLFVMKWSPAAIDALEAGLNPLPTYGGMSAALASRSGKLLDPLVATFSDKEQKLMRLAIQMARRAGIKGKGAELKEFLLNDLKALEKLAGHEVATHSSQIPTGISGFSLGQWLPMNGKLWTFWRQGTQELAIEKVSPLAVAKEVLERAAENAVKAAVQLEKGNTAFAKFAKKLGVTKFMRILHEGVVCLVYEAPGCGEVELAITRGVTQAVEPGLIQQSLDRTRMLWSRGGGNNPMGF